MKSIFFRKPNLVLGIIIFSISAVGSRSRANTELSNLSDVWPIAGTIGDIHGLFRGDQYYGNDTVHFTTGAGNFLMNGITLEFENDSGYPDGVAAPQWVSIQLYQQIGGANILLGSFGNPVADPTPTQWPKSSHPGAYTTFYDFSALNQINLAGLSQYSLVLSMPANSPVDAALMFTRGGYTSSDGWTMGGTLSGNPSAFGEDLKIAVNATRVPDETHTVTLLGVGIVCLAGYRISRATGCRRSTVKFLS